MAALAIPILSAAAPLLMPLITTLIQHVEGMFGPKTGPTKFATVLDAIQPIAANLATAGKIPGVLDPASIAAMIETVVQNLKGQGLLNGTAPPPAVVTAGAIAVPGSTLAPVWPSLYGNYTVAIRPA